MTRRLVYHPEAEHDLTEAAEELGVHPNTLRYRLRRALELAELDLEDGDERVVVELGLLQADHVRPALVQPRQQPRHPLLDRVHVPGHDPHASQRTHPCGPTRRRGRRQRRATGWSWTT